MKKKMRLIEEVIAALLNNGHRISWLFLRTLTNPSLVNQAVVFTTLTTLKILIDFDYGRSQLQLAAGHSVLPQSFRSFFAA